MPALMRQGHRVTRLVRRATKPGTGEISWDPEAGILDAAALAAFDAVIHLAGENIAAGRWSRARKGRILNSRVRGTQLLAGAIASAQKPPKVFISASAVGYYGDRGSEAISEENGPGTGFLAEVCVAWEKAAAVAGNATRVVLLRLGVVLAAEGGALARMLPPFRLGIGGKIGSGDQYMSWIALDDLVEIILFALESSSLQGPVNAVAPMPVTNQDFTRTLARVLRRPAVMSVPALLIKILFGEMGQDVLLSSTRVQPARLTATGYRFRFRELEPALRRLLEHK